MSRESISDKQSVSHHINDIRYQRNRPEFQGAFAQMTGESDLVFVEGKLPVGEGEVQNELPIEQQTGLCLERLDEELSHHDLGLNDVLETTMYLSELDSYEEANEAYIQYFESLYPARTTIGVAELLGGAGIMVRAIAEMP
ncbi:RidA family protein [Natronolimnobius sp. AArcel1]|uniref:RidA family protein n=1 Tax=Natronolimnobius sp. AArcel1 TaxID=1679093 RepID=UPI0013ECAFDC|nr:RidA family protein [Natronolimnobius sp. AArcel1]NGM70359.1 RidA family protein [Natronolimnobius sp. AArcel1]